MRNEKNTARRRCFFMEKNENFAIIFVDPFVPHEKYGIIELPAKWGKSLYQRVKNKEHWRIVRRMFAFFHNNDICHIP